MLTPPVLSDQQISDFKRDGFVITPGVFSAAQVATIDAAMNDLVALATGRDGGGVRPWSGGALSQGKRALSPVRAKLSAPERPVRRG